MVIFVTLKHILQTKAVTVGEYGVLFCNFVHMRILFDTITSGSNYYQCFKKYGLEFRILDSKIIRVGYYYTFSVVKMYIFMPIYFYMEKNETISTI